MGTHIITGMPWFVYLLGDREDATTLFLRHFLSHSDIQHAINELGFFDNGVLSKLPVTCNISHCNAFVDIFTNTIIGVFSGD